LNQNIAEERLASLNAVFSALDHPARRQILLAIKFRGGQMTAGQVAGRFSCAWPTTSRHLRVLTQAGLLTFENHGRERIYRLNDSRLRVAKDWLKWFDDEESDIARQ